MDIKPQDILFLFILVLLVYYRRPQWYVIAGLLSLMLAIPLFTLHVFFTAQRLVMYGAGFIVIGTLLEIVNLRKKS